MDTLAIIKRIELRLAELGMSKSEFYKASGISSASYSQWNSGKYKPSETKLQSAAAVLGVSLEYLRDGTKNKTSTPSDKRQINDEDVKFALFDGDENITDAMFQEVKNFAAYVKQREAKKQSHS